MKKIAIVALALAALAGCSKNPEEPAASRPAPENFRVKFDTSKGPFTIEVTRAMAPLGADRFYDLVQQNFFDDARFFRVLKGFVVQFGINKNPEVQAKWEHANLQDDPVRQTNARGTIVFATGGPNTRTTQLFINLADNARLDQSGFAPFGKVVEGMEVVDSLYGGYGEGAPQGAGPDQTVITSEGNRYLEGNFPKLDFIRTARVVQ
jgi:peptidyl-prolyl cis-trans isomerase A (cyclophilin A)